MMLYRILAEKLNKLTSGYYNDADPVFVQPGSIFSSELTEGFNWYIAALMAPGIYPNSTLIAYKPDR
jgi:hypothetical protein